MLDEKKVCNLHILDIDDDRNFISVEYFPMFNQEISINLLLWMISCKFKSTNWFLCWEMSFSKEKKMNAIWSQCLRSHEKVYMIHKRKFLNDWKMRASERFKEFLNKKLIHALKLCAHLMEFPICCWLWIRWNRRRKCNCALLLI